MKREPILNVKKHYRFKKVHPIFFWKRCTMCEKEFIKEDGWSYLLFDPNDPFAECHDSKYVCKECINDEETLVKSLEKIYAKNYERKPQAKPPKKD